MLFRLLAIFLCLGFLALILPRLTTAWLARPRLYSIGNAPPKGVAVVFGAGLYRNGAPTPVLRDRVDTAAKLFFAGKAQKLLMSGDNRFIFYNEPQAMKEYALSLGVPEEAIVLDNAGHSTYDTCYRAKAIFGVAEALLVTQNFHLPRALYLCRALGIRAWGVSADQRVYHRYSYLYWNLRELFATLNAFIEAHVTRPVPALGRPEPIFPSNHNQ